MTNRLRLARVRAARASSARRSVGGKCTVVVGTWRVPPGSNRIYSVRPAGQCPRMDTAASAQPSDVPGDARDGGGAGNHVWAVEVGSTCRYHTVVVEFTHAP